jgi:DNA invertase Pin-like site-specific DNA recombinase
MLLTSLRKRRTTMTTAIVGYARTSTAEQLAGLDTQVRELRAAGCTEIFSEQVSSVALRAKLDEALRFVRTGDTLIVTKADRLARSTANLLAIITDLETRGVGLIILSLGGQLLDTRNPTSKLLLTMLGAVATFEREIMLERQREGIAVAAAAGKYKGRAPTARAKADDVRQLASEGTTKEAIARIAGISVASVYRILADGMRAA